MVKISTTQDAEDTQDESCSRRVFTCLSFVSSVVQSFVTNRMPPVTQPAVVQYALKPYAVELREVAVPEIEDDEVLLDVGAVSVCGSDVHQARNTHSWPVDLPVV